MSLDWRQEVLVREVGWWHRCKSMDDGKEGLHVHGLDSSEQALILMLAKAPLELFICQPHVSRAWVGVDYN